MESLGSSVIGSLGAGQREQPCSEWRMCLFGTLGVCTIAVAGLKPPVLSESRGEES